MKKKVLVVDDSAFMRKVISDIINSNDNFEVAGIARNGKDALDLIPKLNPDIITLDIEMPIMDGITCLKKIVELYDIPVIMCSSLTKEGAYQTITTLEIGAFDFITKPGIVGFEKTNIKEDLISKLLAASASVNSSKRKYETNIVSKIKEVKITHNFTNISKKDSKINKIVAIGISTGGPKALHEIIPQIPKNIPAPILIVQHMPKGFIKPMAERLDSTSQIRVKEAQTGDILENGVCYIAPGDEHMEIEYVTGKARIKLTDDEKVSGHRPSANVMFKSLSELPFEVIGVIMTGMGSDGTDGLKILKSKKKDSKIIAQDEATSVVFGMPKAAINSGVVDIVAPIYNIIKEICKCLEK